MVHSCITSTEQAQALAPYDRPVVPRPVPAVARKSVSSDIARGLPRDLLHNRARDRARENTRNAKCLMQSAACLHTEAPQTKAVGLPNFVRHRRHGNSPITGRRITPYSCFECNASTASPGNRRWLRPVKSMAKRFQVRGLMCLTSINNITRFYDRNVSAALNIRRCAVGPGPRPTELCYRTNRPAMPKPGQPVQDWVEIPDKPLLRKWQRQSQQ
ncbi:hypothetical protein QJQ45_003631 [Haematococcus lacustris]|nr:hypothetical protein QJQ45_003631 [Haematococcus lacustris]